MQMLKIVTLGESFIFAPPHAALEEISSKNEKGHIVRLYIDEELDYKVRIENPGEAFLPDLYRALTAYIYRLNGFPPSDYEIKVLNTGLKIILPNMCGMIGGNVGKCKILLSESGKFGEIDDVRIYNISSPCGKISVAFCDNVDNFDFKRLLSGVYAADESGESPYALLAVSLSGRNAACKAHLFRKVSGGASCAFAAAMTAIYELFGVRESKISLEEDIACCKYSGFGVFVFDTAPHIYRLP